MIAVQLRPTGARVPAVGKGFFGHRTTAATALAGVAGVDEQYLPPGTRSLDDATLDETPPPRIINREGEMMVLHQVSHL